MVAVLVVVLEMATVDRLVVAMEDQLVADVGVCWEADAVDVVVEVTAMGGWVVTTGTVSRVAWVAVVMEEVMLEEA